MSTFKNIYQLHGAFIQSNTVTDQNMVTSHPTQIDIAQNLLPFFEITIINFFKKLYGCKAVDYHYKASGGKSGEIIINFADQNSVAHLFGLPLAEPRRDNPNHTIQFFLKSYFDYLRANNALSDYIEPTQNSSIDKEINKIQDKVKFIIMSLAGVEDIEKPSIKQEISELSLMINDFQSTYDINSLTSAQAKQLALIIATVKIELENANRTSSNLKELDSIGFKLECFSILTSSNEHLDYDQLIEALGKEYKICIIHKSKTRNVLKSIINLDHYYKTDSKLKEDFFENGFISLIEAIKNPTDYWQFTERTDSEIKWILSVIEDFYEFLGISSQETENLLNFVRANYQNISLTTIENKMNSADNNKYSDIIDELLTALAYTGTSINSISNSAELKEFYSSNFPLFSIYINDVTDFNKITSMLKQYKSEKNYEQRFNQILAGPDLNVELESFIEYELSQENKITKYFILEALEKKLKEKGIDCNILKQIYQPNSIQNTYMLTEYQVKLEQKAAMYDCYQDYATNGRIKNNHSWILLFYKLLQSPEFMTFISQQAIIPNFAKIARKLSLVTTVCNIGEINYEVEIGTPTNGKKEKTIYSLKFGKQVKFGRLDIKKGQQIVLEIEFSGGIYKVNSLKTDSPVGTKKIDGLSTIKIVYLINEESLRLLQQLNLVQFQQLVAPRKIL